jgi:RNA polymerase sigma-70 factor, ECF subfamily
MRSTVRCANLSVARPRIPTTADRVKEVARLMTIDAQLLATAAEMSHSTDQKRRFEEEAIPYMAQLYPAALRLTRQHYDAEDLLQETFTRAYLKFHQFTPGTNMRAWLSRLLVTTFYTGCRRRGRYAGEVLTAGSAWETADRVGGLAPTCRSAESEAIDNLAGSFVMRALGELPDGYKAAVYLADVHGYRCHEIAQMLGTPLGTVMSRIHRGRQMLRAKTLRRTRTRRRSRAGALPRPGEADRAGAAVGHDPHVQAL